MARTAINLYSVRDLDEPLLDVLERVAEAGYDGVQFSGGLGDATPLEVRDALDDLELEPTAAHVGIDDLETDLDDIVDTYAATLGCDGLVVPWLDPEGFESAETVDSTADRLESLAGEVGERDLDLHYHNHAHEFVDLDGEAAFERLADATDDLLFELDVGWVHTGGSDPVELIERFGDRISVVHVKDMTAEGEFAEIGEGVVDMEACADAAREVGAAWLVYEHDEPENPRESIETGARYLDSL